MLNIFNNNLIKIAEIYLAKAKLTDFDLLVIRSHFHNDMKFCTFLFELLKAGRDSKISEKYVETLGAFADEQQREILTHSNFELLSLKVQTTMALYAVRLEAPLVLLTLHAANKEALKQKFCIRYLDYIFVHVDSALMLDLLLSLNVHLEIPDRCVISQMPLMYFLLAKNIPEITHTVLRHKWTNCQILNAKKYAGRKRDRTICEMLQNILEKQFK